MSLSQIEPLLPQLTEIPGGYRVKTLPSGMHIELHRMFYNWRVVRSYPDESGWDRGFCYFGLDFGSFAKAVLAANAWDGSDDSEPAGYDKRVRV